MDYLTNSITKSLAEREKPKKKRASKAIDQSKIVTLHVRLTENLYSDIAAKAAEHSLTVSQFVRIILGKASEKRVKVIGVSL